ncbi:DUF3159 domain-containing protein [Planctomonas psychrotolerans]|uniref:DUF3159 domain-containing protein n=1 Tax=Planctomonas psychrotolerans TaxID=2528712 RepID=UPI00123BE987|nr:DUF3159 domain-containing protein [Planctomonas psychrotolerans]
MSGSTPPTGREPDAGGAADPDRASRDALANGLADAARRAGFGTVAEGDRISPRDVLGAMGGVRGILEAVLPGLVFILLFTFTRDLLPSVIAPAVVGVVFVVLRLVQRSPATPAIAGLIGIVISALLALRTGEGKDFFVLGFWTNGAYLTAFLLSILVGWPLLGLAVGFLMGEGTAWKRHRPKFRAMRMLTLIWAGFFGLRLAVQMPLYFADNVEALGVTRLVMSTPMYGVLLVLSWLFVRAVYAKYPADRTDSADAS